MVVTKRKISITIDCDLYEAAKTKYGKISPRVNELLSMDLYGSNEKDILIEKLHEVKMKEKMLVKQICELEKEEANILKDESNKTQVLNWVKMVYSQHGVIGLNKLREECKRKFVDVDEIINILDQEGIAYVNFT